MKKGIAFCFVAMSFLFMFSMAHSQPAALWRTGQTMSYATGDDGALQRGIASPTPRFMDNGDGTVTDNLTGLMWLKDASCFWKTPGTFPSNWQEALDNVADLNVNPGRYSCGDYKAAYNDWRLPNRKELRSLTDFSRYDPALPEEHPFLHVRATGYNYWSSTTVANYDTTACVVYMYDGSVTRLFKSYWAHVWPVRAGQTGEIKVPAEPVLTVSTSEATVTISWNPVMNASGYTFSYAFYPYNPGDLVYSLDLGTQTSLVAELWYGAAFYVAVQAYNDAGNSGYSNIEYFEITEGGDTSPPSVPSSLATTTLSSSQINLSWVASTDNLGVTGYKIYRDGTYLKTVIATSTSDTGLSSSTRYCYTVSAFDAAGNVSDQSDQACTTTNQAVPIVLPGTYEVTRTIIQEGDCTLNGNSYDTRYYTIDVVADETGFSFKAGQTVNANYVNNNFNIANVTITSVATCNGIKETNNATTIATISDDSSIIINDCLVTWCSDMNCIFKESWILSPKNTNNLTNNYNKNTTKENYFPCKNNNCVEMY